MPSIQQIENDLFPAKRADVVQPGDKVRVHIRIEEVTVAADKGAKMGHTKQGEEKVKFRTQVFEGMVVAVKHTGPRRTFTVRKVSYGVGVERVFPIESPVVEKIEVLSHHRVRRSKLYFLRERHGKSARLKEIRDN